MAEFDATEIERLLASARNFFSSSDFAQLRAISGYIVTLDPGCAEAWHLAGLGEAGCGEQKLGLAMLTRAAKLNPGDASILGNLGQLLLNGGEAQAALLRLEQALQIAPLRGDIHFNHGNALLRLGLIDRAVQSYSRCIELQPDHAEALNNRGILNAQQGRHEPALQDFERCLALRPYAASAWVNQGNTLKALARLEDAVNAYERALAINPALPEAQNNLGNVLLEQQRFDEALVRFEHALALRGDYAEAWRGKGLALSGLSRKLDARTCFERAIELRPDLAQAHTSRADLLLKEELAAEALGGYDAGLLLEPNNVTALNNRGNALKLLGRLEEAHQSYTRAIELNPKHAWAHCNRANLHVERLRFDEARADYLRAIALKSDFADAHAALAFLLLQLGEFETGWPEYEWRLQKPAEKKLARPFAQPQWVGQQPLAGQTLLLHAEQGYGDTIQFCRYAAKARALGAGVVLEVPARLRELLHKLPGVDSLLVRGEPLPQFDMHCPLGSMPLAMSTRLDSIPAATPYLHAQPERVARWRPHMGSHGFRVAIAWQGSTGEIDRGRSFPVNCFAPLATLPGVRLISIQKNQGVEQLADLPAGLAVESLGDDCDSGPDAFLDTAAVMQCVDLVITSDTAVAHLAGALGVPVWVALKRVPDWRWLLERSDSPWYPTMRLFRQEVSGEWGSVFASMRQALAELRAA